MSATPTTYLEDRPSASCYEQNVAEVREWERFKWLARGLSQVVDGYDVARLEELLNAPPSMPGQREKVLVLLALKATPQANWVLEHLDIDDYDASFRKLHKVALRYVGRKRKEG
jgi:hypothetical protein